MYSMTGLSMPWMGMIGTDFSSGYMFILETPDDSEIKVRRIDGLISFEPVWLSTKDEFGYARNLVEKGLI
jgi:hypothetical protein